MKLRGRKLTSAGALLLFALLLTVVVAACGGGGSSSSSTEKNRRRPKKKRRRRRIERSRRRRLDRSLVAAERQRAEHAVDRKRHQRRKRLDAETGLDGRTAETPALRHLRREPGLQPRRQNRLPPEPCQRRLRGQRRKRRRSNGNTTCRNPPPTSGVRTASPITKATSTARPTPPPSRSARKTGEKVWETPNLAEAGTEGFNIQPQPYEGKIFLSTSGQLKGGIAYALDAKTGKVLWEFEETKEKKDREAGGEIGTGGAWNSPAIGPEGEVFFGDRQPLPLDRTGDQRTERSCSTTTALFR